MFSRPVAPPIETLPLGSTKAPGALFNQVAEGAVEGTLCMKSSSNSAPIRALPTSTARCLARDHVGLLRLGLGHGRDLCVTRTILSADTMTPPCSTWVAEFAR